MADSNITKQALAASLKNLMEEVPFDKINVARICEGCGMSRKSFYYHFKDKYDLVNWIFDTEFLEVVTDYLNLDNYTDRWKLIETSCTYFYENRSFYRKALQIKGQNSFPDHLREIIQPILKARLGELDKEQGQGMEEFALDFFVDAIVDAIVRWLTDKDCIPAEEFVEKVRHLVESTATAIYREADENDSL